MKNMRPRLALSLTAAALTALLAPSGATAATEFGDNCVANSDFESAVTFFESVAPGNPLPVSAPSSGVITKWKSSVVPVPFGIPQTFKVLRLDPATKIARVIAEEPRAIVTGPNSFDTRIPIQVGDRISLFGTGVAETLICATPGVDSLIGGFAGNGGGVGSSNPYIELPEEFRIPLAAVLEPDADNDGFGDETQDRCPQSAAIQAECPLLVVDSFAIPRKNKVLVLVATSSSANVSVSGTARFPNVRRKARSSAQARLPKVTKLVPSGTLTRFTLKLPAKLKSALSGLPRGKSATLRIQASTTDLAGRPAIDRANLKLRGAKKRRTGGKG